MNDIIYNDLMQSIPNTIFNKYFKGFLKYKDDMIQTAYLQIWKSKNKFNPNKGKLESFMATICWNTFNKFIRDNVYKDKDNINSIVNIDTVEYMNADYDGRNEKRELINSMVKTDKHYLDIEYRELMEKFDNRVKKENKEGGGKETDLEELHKIIDLLLEGYNQSEIGRMMGKDFRIINKKIKRIRNIFNRIL